MKELTNKRTKRLVTEINGTGIAINYTVSQESAGKKEVTTAVFGTIKKGDLSIGSISYQKDGDRMHLSFDPFTGTTTEEKAMIAATATGNVAEILK